MTDKADLQSLQALFDKEMRERDWLKLLKFVGRRGIADTVQIQTGTGMGRDRVKWVIGRMLKWQAQTGMLVLEELNRTLPRPGVRGRAPKIYKLTKDGVRLLQGNDSGDARLCELKDDTPLAHALAEVDVMLVAERAGLTIAVERPLTFGENQQIRPDGVVTLLNGTRILVEIEQLASFDLLRRVHESVQHKEDFFQSQTGRGFDPRVRMCINLPRGKDWDRTLRVWSQAIKLVCEAHGKQALSFCLYAMPLAEFLKSPTWASPVEDGRWIELTKLPHDNSQEAKGTSAVEETLLAPNSATALEQFAAHDDQLILQSLYRFFVEEARHQPQEFPQPNPSFFELMKTIYAAAHDRCLSLLEQAAVPHASIYLLREYLRMHPNLRSRVEEALHRGGGAMRWSVPSVLNRMDVTARTFLAYHGWSGNCHLKVFATLTAAEDGESAGYAYQVQIPHAELLMSEKESLVPGRDELERAARALAWVLWAILEYAESLGIRPPNFW